MDYKYKLSYMNDVVVYSFVFDEQNPLVFNLAMKYDWDIGLKPVEPQLAVVGVALVIIGLVVATTVAVPVA